MAKAKEYANKLPIYPGSHRGAMANLVGCLGEIMVYKWLSVRGLDPTPVHIIDHDMEITTPTGQRLHFDIKTKDRTVRPSPSYEATVPEYVYDKQQPHYYVFASLYRERGGDKSAFTECFIVGSVSRKRFDADKYHVEAGPKPNGAVFFCSAWNMLISDLDDPMSFPPSA